MSITHEQARKLIQLNMDQVLNAEESGMLSAHLHHCGECMAYEREIKAVAKMLSPIMKRQWNVTHVPLSVAALLRKNENTQSRAFLTMRTVAATFVLMALFFSAWQVVVSSPSPVSQLSSAIPPVPTPSSPTMQSISTQLTLEGCVLMSYRVQENDTLARIADQFSISEEMILAINDLESEIVNPSMELEIPKCNFTPTGTFRAATLTTTNTPIIWATDSTPGG